MSYQHRKRKRKAAHWLLRISTNDFEVTGSAYIKETPSSLKTFYPMSIVVIFKRYKKFDVKTLVAAAALLESNSHIDAYHNPSPGKYGETNFAATSKGWQAYLDDFYIIENEKDFEDLIDRKTKWILPFVSIGISLVALIVSLYAAFHPNK